MKKSIALVIALLTPCASPLLAQNAPPAPASAKVPAPEDKKPAPPAPKESGARPVKKAEAKVAPISTPLPTPRKAERIAVAPRATRPPEGASDGAKVSFWKKVFGGRKATPAPTTPAATPAATPRGRRPRPMPTEETGEVAKREDSAKSGKPKRSDEKPGEENPAPEVPDKTPDTTAKADTESPDPVTPPAPAATPAPVKKPGKTRAVVETKDIPPTTSAETEVQEKYKYDMAKAKALTDPEVLKLKEKADSAVNEDEARKAQRAYTKALFDKMRSVDGSIKERADRIEAGILRRLDVSE